jgi:signal transduction histidine kinase
MNSVVQDMLELSRMESGSVILKWERFALQDLLNEIIEESGNSTREKRIKMSVKAGHGPVFITADRSKIGHVIGNFMANAIRHTPLDGEIWIEIGANEEGVTFLIENQGEPIPKDKIERVWERFYRVEPSRTRSTGGTGLGLAISAKILQLHHARYGVRNTEKGVLFYFEIADRRRK